MNFTQGVALTGVFAVGMAGAAATFSPVAKSLRNGEPLAGVVLGTDKVTVARHSDTLMAWNYNPRLQKLDVLSIPRDTKITLPGYRFRRINEVFAYHFRNTDDAHRAAREVLNVVNGLLNTGNERFFDARYYLHVDYNGFREIIDLVGGINVHVDEPMHYDDKAGDLHIHFDPGDHRLDGGAALEYVRFRGLSGDKGRILRQMDFLKSLVAKLSSPVVALRAPRLFSTVFSHVHSNFKPWDIVFLALESKHVRPERLNPRLLPGHPKGPYWEMERDRVNLVVQQMMGFQKPLVTTEVKMEEGATTVKVYNGTRRSGLALKVTRRLRAKGFDVLEWGTYGRQTKTRVLDRSGDYEKAQAVARALGVPFVFSDVNPKLRTDVEVLVGDDYVDRDE